MRGGKPLELKIDGKDSLRIKHHDVMLESVATSLQIHSQINAKDAIRHYNLSQILCAPIVAVAANSPYLFCKDLWADTRIPTFEQSVSVASFLDLKGQTVGRVTFGTGYVKESLLELFLENLDGFPVLLPLVFDEDPSWLSHLRLQNGTIWRWTRPSHRLDQGRQTTSSHRTPRSFSRPQHHRRHRQHRFLFRIDDLLSLNEKVPLEHEIPFENARDNFYAAAKFGMDANSKMDRRQNRLSARLY